MNDLQYSASTVEDGRDIIRKVSETVEKGKLPLIKWAANCKELLENVEKTRQADVYNELGKAGSGLKILGLHFNPR